MTIKNVVFPQFIALSTGILLLLLTGFNKASAWEACPPVVEVKSSNSNTATSITFTLDASAPFPLDIMWIDQSGNMKKYNRLVPGQSYTQATYVGHMWAAHDGGSCEYFEATSSPLNAQIVIDDYQNDPTTTAGFTAEEEFFGTEVYSTVRGWRVVQGDVGCSAYKPGTGPSIVFNTPPAGGWQIIYHYLGKEGDIPGMVDVDKYSFPKTFFAEGGWAYGDFPLNERLAAKAGRYINTDIDSVKYEESLTGSTAALLKLQECWQKLSGWTPASNKVGTFAFSGR